MLRARVLTALFLAPVVILLAYAGSFPWLSVVLLIGIQAWREMASLLQRDHVAIDHSLGLFFLIGAVLEAYVRTTALIPVDLLRPMLAGLIVFSLIWALYDRSEQPTANWGITLAAALYLGYLLGHFVTLRERPLGFQWVMTTLLVTWTSDTMAYFVGSALGKHKMWPRLSPKKTWEGLAGGTAGALIAAPLLAHWWLGLNPWLGLLLGAMIAGLAPFGDLAVSLFKRMAHAKDSSQLIPGHGGALDRLDSLLFTFPAATYFAMLVSG